MNLIQALRQALYGWIMILRNEAGWQARFRLTWPGLATALVLFYLFTFLALVLGSLDFGVPTLSEAAGVMAYQSIWLAALVIGLFGTRFAVRDTGPVLQVLVPGIYALIFYLILGALLSLVAGFLLPLLWIGLVYLLFRLGRMAGGWTIGVAAAFAVLSVALLVGTPIALYMLTAPIPDA